MRGVSHYNQTSGSDLTLGASGSDLKLQFNATQPAIEFRPYHESQQGQISIFNLRSDPNGFAFYWLDRAYDERAGDLTTITTDPPFDRLWTEPRYLALLRKMGLKK